MITKKKILMNKKDAAYLKAKFEEIVNNHVTTRYETDVLVNYNDSAVIDLKMTTNIHV